MSAPARVSLLTLGCARNEVDSSELAGRLELGGYQLVDDAADGADVVVVNTCAFVADAKKDSIDTLLAAADSGAKVVAVGCLAERYGQTLADDLPEADAVLGFDRYADLPALLGDVLAGHRPPSHRPVDRRTLLPISPVARPAAARKVAVPGHDATPASGPVLVRRLLHRGPVAPLKIASGCDRRCTFCAIPSFRGSFVSRAAAEIVDEAHWLAGQGVREVVLVSENSTSYGKDLPGDLHLERLLGELAAVPGIVRVRLSYLQPAETRPPLLAAIAGTPGVADYYDMSFQHASGPVLRRMRRFGDRPSFLDLVERIRAQAPEAGIRSNVIVGFPGETEDDLAELAAFLTGARLDAVGVFGYSDEDGTAAERLAGKHDDDEIAERVERISALADELVAQRAEDRIGTEVSVLVESVGGSPAGRAGHQAPEVDGVTALTGADGLAVGDLVAARVVGSDGADLVAAPLRVLDHAAAGWASMTAPRPVPVVNLPNVLTVTRLLLVPIFLLCLFAEGGDDTTWRLVATGVFAVAALTDRYDGRIARSRGLVTNFGKVADPIADKALTGAALIGLSILGELPWWVTVVILVREIGVTLLRLAILRYQVVPASQGGKLKTLVQMIAIGLYLLPLPDGLNWLRIVTMGLAVLLTVATGIDYVVKVVKIITSARQARHSSAKPA